MKISNFFKGFAQLEILIVGSFITLYTLAASLVSLNRYWQFNAFWLDFGILDETIWKLSRFKLPIIATLNPPIGNLVWGDHLNPSAIFLAPLYWLSDKQEIILVAQAVVVALTAAVLYSISRKKIQSSLARISLVVSFLGFVGMQNALFTDIHNIVFALLPLSLCFWAIYTNHWKLYWLFFLVSLGFQENIAGVGVGIGLFLLLRKEKNIKVGLLTILISLIYGLVATKFLMPMFAGHAYTYSPVYPHVLSGWITQFFVPVDTKLKTLFFTFATFGFLPLLSPATAPLIIEHYLERFVLNSAGTRWDLGFHYNSLASLIMAIGSIEVLTKIQAKKFLSRFISLWSFVTIVGVIFLHRFYLHGPLLLATNPIFYAQTANSKVLRDFETKLPKQGLIMAQNNIAAHLTHTDVTLLNGNYKSINPDWIVVDTRPGQNANNFFPLSPNEFDNLVASVSADVNYKRYFTLGSQIIFSKQ